MGNENNSVLRPSYYCDGRKYEPKDVIRDWGLNFNIGSAVQYLSEAGRKRDIIEDLEKAKQFIQFEIDYLRQEEDKIECVDLPQGAEVTVSFLDNEEYEKWKQKWKKQENHSNESGS